MQITLHSLPDQQVRIAQTSLTQLTQKLLQRAGLSQDRAHQLANSLIEADLRGVHSHGVMRLPVYVRRLQQKGFDALTEPEVIRETATTGLVDGHNCPGFFSASLAMDVAIKKAKETGVGVVSVRNSNHNGTGAQYVAKATAANMIGIATSNASPIMPAWGGKTPVTGPLPLAIGAPANGDPVIMDMALGMSSRGKILQYAERNHPLPDGWLVDANGNPTNDPHDLDKGGWIPPVGGHKGWGLILMCEILTGILSGGSVGQDLTNLYDDLDTPQQNSHLMIAINIENFMDPKDFATRLERYLEFLRASEPAAGFNEILIPGDLEKRAQAKQQQEGITLTQRTINEIIELAQSLSFDLSVHTHAKS